MYLEQVNTIDFDNEKFEIEINNYGITNNNPYLYTRYTVEVIRKKFIYDCYFKQYNSDNEKIGSNCEIQHFKAYNYEHLKNQIFDFIMWYYNI